jgi:soluble lytic murein transglycosylase-like protein
MKGHLLLVCPAMLLCLWATPAQAQIYALRDQNGVLTLSDKPLGEGAQAFAVAGAAGIRTTVAPVGVRASQWDDLIDERAAAHGIRPELVRAVIQVESAFNPRARSVVGAMGLMQLMPGTASDLGVTNPYDPEQNIRGGVAYLRSLLDRFNGNEVLALAAYNAGPGAVTRYGSTVPPYRETRDYVQKVQRRSGTLAPVPRNIVYRVVELVDGEEVVRYTNVKPKSGQFEVIQARRAVEQ